MKVAGNFANHEELAARNALEDLLVAKGLGEVVDAGTGFGVMELSLETDRPVEASRVIDAFLREKHLLARATVEVLSPVPSETP